MTMVRRYKSNASPEGGMAVRLKWLACAAAMLGVAVPVQARNPSPWAAMARQDLAAIQSLLRANHPGAVDTERRYYADWLERGFVEADARAARATTLGEYVRTLRFYVNGFRDSHTQLALNVTSKVRWPGFTVHRASDGRIRVKFAETGSKVAVADEVLSCDGTPIERLIADRVAPLYFNPDVPHANQNQIFRVLYTMGNDPDFSRSCRFQTAKGTADIALNWRSSEADDYFAHIYDGSGGSDIKAGIRTVGDVTFISVPTLVADSPDQLASLEGIIAEVRARAAGLRNGGPVVIDVRGKGGGNSVFAERIAAALWGEELVEWVAAPFDWTVDWRVSPDNLERLRAKLDWARTNKQDESYAQRSLAAAERAAKEGRALARLASPGKPRSATQPANPVRAKVYFLTDNGCGSSCLDSADIVTRIPGVTHVGLPTYADAIYIDVGAPKALPSGIADLVWSLKVYRNRIRDHNAYYKPKIAWPGGPMTYDSVAKWVAGLAR